MTEHPILFKGSMVNAILAGTKTVTRRVIGRRMQPAPGSFETGYAERDGELWYDDNPWCVVPSPYGEGGKSTLWVRETFSDDCPLWPGYWCGCGTKEMQAATHTAVYRADGEREKPGWRRRWVPSIHMPRWASRITLEVLDVRVERVQEITEADALAEGVEYFAQIAHGDWSKVATRQDIIDADARAAFRRLWNAINCPRGFGWDVNPYVWAVTFRRIES